MICIVTVSHIMAFARDDVSRRRLRSNSKDVAYPLLGSKSSSRVFVGPGPRT